MDTRKLRLGRSAGAALLSMFMVGALAACGADGSGGEDPTPTVEAPTTPLPSETTEPEPTEPEETGMPDETPSLDPSMGTDKSGSKSEMTITGTIESGVESGCLIMNYDGEVYGIFGEYDSSIVYAGAEVTLHGHLESDMMSFCQQGTPFVVEEAESAG